MKSRHVWTLFGLALLVRLATAALIPEPGYMDTAYYAADGLRLAVGAGATEPFVWNYLHPPAALPQPAFGYWMPLPSLLTVPFWRVGGTFFAAQVPFAILSSLLVVGGALFAWSLTHRMRSFWGAGGLLIFSGAYFPFWTLPETFAPYAVGGALALWASGRYWETRQTRWLMLAAGAAAGAYLTRSDGVLFVAGVLLLPVLRRDFKGLLAAGSVAALLLTPWMAYNWHTRGALLPTGGTRTLWLTNYDDLYCYHCSLTPRTYWAWGWRAILASKWRALLWNAETLWAVIGYVFLAPLTVVGAWRLRREPAFVMAWGMLGLLGAAMTFAFTFPGPRGGFFHCGGAFLPFVVAAGLVGLDRVTVWLGAKRAWNIPQAQTVFTVGAVLIAAGISLTITSTRVAEWRGANGPYRVAGAWLAAHDARHTPVLVGDPPRFWYVTHIPALAAPNEPPAVTLDVARRYGACWLLLDKNRPQPLAALYATDELPPWSLAVAWDDVRLYHRRDCQQP